MIQLPPPKVQPPGPNFDDVRPCLSSSTVGFAVCSVAVSRSLLIFGSQQGLVLGKTLADYRAASGVASGMVNSVAALDIAAHRSVVTDLLVLSDAAMGESLLSGSADGSVKHWELPRGQWRMGFTTENGAGIQCIVTVNNGASLVAGCSDGALRWWTIATGAPGPVIRCHSGAIRSLLVPHCATPDHPVPLPSAPGAIITASDDGHAKLLNPASASVVALFVAEEPILCAAYDHPHLLVGRADGRVRGFHVHTAAPTFSYREHTDAVNALVVLGDFIFSSSDDGTVAAWSKSQWKVRYRFSTATTPATAVSAGSAPPSCLGRMVTVHSSEEENDSARLVTVGMDGSVRHWDRKAVTNRIAAFDQQQQAEAAAAQAATKKKKEDTEKGGGKGAKGKGKGK